MPEIYLPRKEYFEGVLQLRSVSQEVIDWIKSRTKKDARAAITREKIVPGGFDLYFSSQKYLRTLGKKLGETFPGILTTARALHTRSKTGKDLYRVTVCFKGIQFRRGETITYQDELWKVTEVKEHTTLKNLRTGKRKRVKTKELLPA